MSEAYYSQWQRFPKPAKDWQREESRVFHKGRLAALHYVIRTSRSVLDVGCGIGLDWLPLSNIRYMGVDVTPKFIEAAKKNGVPCRLGSVLDLRFDDGTFDTVYCRNLLLHLPPDQVFIALDEMARVAGKQVVTVEPAWENQSNYVIRELIDNDPSDLLMFFSNTYSEYDMEQYAVNRGLELHLTRGHDENRSDFLRRPVDWQVTVYSKSKKVN